MSAILDARAEAVCRELAADGPMTPEMLTESLGWRPDVVDQVVDHLAADGRVELAAFDGWVEVDVPHEELTGWNTRDARTPLQLQLALSDDIFRSLRYATPGMSGAERLHVFASLPDGLARRAWDQLAARWETRR